MKRIGAILLTVCLLLPTLAAFEPPAQAAAGIKVLAIGHSYSNNATEYIDDIIESMGYAGKLEVYSLYYQGCSLNQHVSFYNDNQAVYELWRGGRNIKGAGQLITMQEALDYARYDYVTLQQQPGQSAFFSTYEPALGQLAAIVRRNQPKAKLQMHQTWGPCNYCAVHGDRYNAAHFGSSAEAFAANKSSYEQAAQKIGATGIVPSGEAVQLAKKRGYYDGHNPNAVGDVLQCQNNALYADDIHHLNQRGKYLAACVWVEHFLGKDTRTATFVPPVLDEDDCAKLRQIAHEVVTGDTTAYAPTTVGGGKVTTTKKPVTTTATTTTTTTTTQAVEQPDNGMLMVLVAALGGGVLLIAGIVVAIILILKKK